MNPSPADFTCGAPFTFKSRRLELWVDGQAQVIIRDGAIIESVTNQSKISREELESALREAGFFDLKQIKIAMLESNGRVSVQRNENAPPQCR